MTNAEQLQAALHSSQPGQALRAAVDKLAAEGLGKAETYALLHTLWLDLSQGEKADGHLEETVLDVLDALSDWCHPAARLPTEAR